MFGFGKSRTVTCPYCFERLALENLGNRSSTKLKCRACSTQLPLSFLDYKSNAKDLLFSIIGAKDTGKSNYIAVLINELRGAFGAQFDTVLRANDDPTSNRYRDEYYHPLYRDKTVVKVTASALARKPEPLSYTLAFGGKSFFGRPKVSQVAFLTLFDTAGEDFNSEDTLSTHNRYIFNSHGIILLLDPLQLPQVRDRLKGSVTLPAIRTDAGDIIDRVARLIRKAYKLRANDLIKIPIAIAFTKCDALRPLMTPGTPLSYVSKHVGYFDESDYEDVAGFIRALIVDWTDGALLQQLKLGFKHYGLFGLSALGEAPSGPKVTAIRPMRVTDPLIWHLARQRLVRHKRN